jgi:hypothetical protein
MPAASRLLIQVVPQLLPGRNGVSDQAVLLAGGLKEDFGIESAFVVLNSTESSRLPYPEVHCEPGQLLESCLKLTGGEPGAILVHVSGYGYSTDGAPALVADALQDVRASGRLRIAAYFHELYATGMPWKRAFWHSRRQRRAVCRIASECGLIVTNLRLHAERLERGTRRSCGTPIECLPVISPSGETEDPTPFAERNAVMVVFGLAGTRRLAYRQITAARNLIDTLGIEEILDVGPECDCPSSVNGAPVERVGLKPAEELPALFSQTQFGFVPHPWFCLGKSSVFAAYCAQGTIPVLTGPFPAETDGLRDGVHVVSPRTAEVVRSSGWEACSRSGWNWYMGHRLRAHLELYAKWLGERR